MWKRLEKNMNLILWTTPRRNLKKSKKSHQLIPLEKDGPMKLENVLLMYRHMTKAHCNNTWRISRRLGGRCPFLVFKKRWITTTIWPSTYRKNDLRNVVVLDNEKKCLHHTYSFFSGTLKSARYSAWIWSSQCTCWCCGNVRDPLGTFPFRRWSTDRRISFLVIRCEMPRESQPSSSGLRRHDVRAAFWQWVPALGPDHLN